jgi:hypothetical protein
MTDEVVMSSFPAAVHARYLRMNLTDAAVMDDGQQRFGIRFAMRLASPLSPRSGGQGSGPAGGDPQSPAQWLSRQISPLSQTETSDALPMGVVVAILLGPLVLLALALGATFACFKRRRWAPGEPLPPQPEPSEKTPLAEGSHATTPATGPA